MSSSKKHSFTFDGVHLAPDKQIGLHQQSTWELSYIIVGSGMRLIGETMEHFSSGEVIMVPPEIPHCWYFDSDVTDARGRIANITITFGKEFLDNCYTTFPELAEYIDKLKSKRDAVKFDEKRTGAIIPILEEMARETNAGRVALMIKLLLVLAESGMEHIVGKYRKIDKEKNRLNQIQTYVICNAKREITLSEIAQHVGMNRASFCVFFKKATGKTFINYLNEYRVELACRLLEQKKMAVSEICYQVGFNNVPYFNRVFKRLMGMPPTEYSVSPV